MINKKIRPIDLPVVILCGGKGARMGPEELPKPMFTIGEHPILWHIMKIYSYYGFNDFILATGYRKEKINEFADKYSRIHKWNIRAVDTGLETNTGGRIKKIQGYIKKDNFFVTYGDGLADIDIKALLKYHLQRKAVGTLTAVRPTLPFGLLSYSVDTGRATSFLEKPELSSVYGNDYWINGGFFVFNKNVFDYIKENSILESDMLPMLAKEKKLFVYPHNGFWECMDTYKDNQKLNELWKSGKKPWAVWVEETEKK